MAQEYFEPAKGGLVVDVSCGSGLFSRKFAKSGTYSGVIALDFSENMLRQCNDFIKKDVILSTKYCFPPLLDSVFIVANDLHIQFFPFARGYMVVLSLDSFHYLQ